MDLTTPMYGNQNEGLPETTKRNGISKRMPIVKTETWSSKPERRRERIPRIRMMPIKTTGAGVGNTLNTPPHRSPHAGVSRLHTDEWK